ncbi:MAG: gliding motility-associated ABC transporter permease subunit GldF [Bacteroidales bacterium]|jgi:ABC-2 type transport system permease protein|nr:gliding motility-associated ABC transporter permease subunit GldF [Bacteroidales bacterium]
MYSLFLKEIKVFLNSLIGYLVIGVFISLTGLFLWVFDGSQNILNRGFADLSGLFAMAPLVFLLLVPAVTMRSFAEENRLGTVELLFTMPLSDLKIIISKYLASIVLIVIALLPTFVYCLSVYFLGLPKGNLDLGALYGSYIGLLLLGASFAAIGIFCSLLTDSQIVAFVISLLICLFLWLGFELIYSFAIFGSFGQVIRWFGIDYHYASISRGVIDTRDILYFLSLIALFLGLSKWILAKRK